MMKGGIAGLMKQAQQMQDNMKKMQDSLGDIEVEGQSGAGMVKVTMTCKYDVRRVAEPPRTTEPLISFFLLRVLHRRRRRQ